MKRLDRFIILLITLGLLGITMSAAYAQPPLPSGFYGKVKINGANVPDDTIVSARINSMQYASATVIDYNGDTVYSFDVPGDDPGTPEVIEGGIPGSTIDFFIGFLAANQTSTWQSGTNIELDLTAQKMNFNFLPIIVR